MVLKLFTPSEAKTLNSAQNTRDIVRTQEIRKLVSKSQTELAKHEANFSEMLARHREKWAKEEEEHNARLLEMGKEVFLLEETRKNALIPIEIEKRKADTMLNEAEKRLGEVKKKEKENEDLKEIILERISLISERESTISTEEERIVELRNSAELEKKTAALNTNNLSEGIKKFNEYVLSETTLLDAKRTDITLKERSIQSRQASLDSKEKSLAIREAQFKDKQETLARAFEEYRIKTNSSKDSI